MKELFQGFSRLLDPMDRIAEVLFGLIMVLTFTCTFGVLSADTIAVHAMLLAALGCNLAWGIIDAGMYLVARVHEQGRNTKTLRALRDAPDIASARRILSDAVPPLVASVITSEQLEIIERKFSQMPAPSAGPKLTRDDWLGAAALCVLSFVSAFPIVIPFILIDDARVALRTSNAIAIVMLFLCGYALGHYSGLRPWLTGLSMVALGVALVGVAIALGG